MPCSDFWSIGRWYGFLCVLGLPRAFKPEPISRFRCRLRNLVPFLSVIKTFEKEESGVGAILLIILILLLIGALPTWPYSSGWGYYPSGGLGLVLLILLILVLMGRI
jgi:Protein of unknown function (DUF3309)